MYVKALIYITRYYMYFWTCHWKYKKLRAVRNWLHMTEATDKEKNQLEVIGVLELLLHTAAMNWPLKIL